MGGGETTPMLGGKDPICLMRICLADGLKKTNSIDHFLMPFPLKNRPDGSAQKPPAVEWYIDDIQNQVWQKTRGVEGASVSFKI